MAICPGCGKEIRDDIWVCGHCGVLVAGGAPSSPGGRYGGAGAAGGWSASAGPTADPAAGMAPFVAGMAPSAAGGELAYAGPPTGAAALPAGAIGLGEQPLPGRVSGARQKAQSRGTSRAVVIAAIVGFLAVAAIVAVWFFVLRGGGGDVSPYVGQWQITVPGTAMAQTLTIADADGQAELTMAVSQTAQTAGQMPAQVAGPYRMELDGDRLYTTFEPTDDASEEQKAAAEMITSAFGAMVDDFKMVFTRGSSPDVLTLSIEGELKNGVGSLAALGGQETQLSRVPETQ
jgi:hypothetical protein